MSFPQPNFIREPATARASGAADSPCKAADLSDLRDYARALSFRCLNGGDLPSFVSEAQRRAQLAQDCAKLMPEIALKHLFNPLRQSAAPINDLAMRAGGSFDSPDFLTRFELGLGTSLDWTKPERRLATARMGAYNNALRRDMGLQPGAVSNWTRAIRPLPADRAESLWLQQVHTLAVQLRLTGPLPDQMMEI
ncbi:MAG: hypothetical protein Alpg2KO_14360 [Alphaproteobacteria bacterium]